MEIINQTQALSTFCSSLAKADFITVDTEFMRESTFWPILCLIQIAGPDRAAIIDPLAAGIDLAPVFALLADTKVLKVFHAARQDIEIFHHLTGTIPTPLFDTQIAAMVCGFGEQASYETLTAQLAKAAIDKSSRFTDWSRRPLSERQLEYALSDVTHLRVIYEKLSAELKQSGRMEWLGGELAILNDPKTYTSPPEDAWRRIKIRSLKPKILSMLAALAAWRERQAQARNLPRNRILRDEALIEIATDPPRSIEQLSRIRGLSKGLAEGRLGSEILTAIKNALDNPVDIPATKPQDIVLPRGLGPLVDLLKVLLKYKCESHDIAQKLVASAADLEKIAADDNADVPALSGWRFDIFGADALALKQGKLALAADHKKIKLITVGD